MKFARVILLLTAVSFHLPVAESYGSPSDPALRERMEAGHKLAREGKLEAAITVFESILDSDSSELEAMRILTELYLRNGDRAKSIELHRQWIKRDPRSMDARLRLARIHAEGGQVEDAVRLYNQILAFRPDRLDVALELAPLLVEAGRAVEARQALLNSIEAAVGRDDRDKLLLADLHFTLAMMEQENEAWKFVATHLEKALEEFPLHQDALLMSTNLALRERRYEDAKEHFITLLNASPVIRPNVGLVLKTLPFPAAPAVLVPACYESGESGYAEDFLRESIEQAKRMQRPDWVIRLEALRKDS